MFVNFNLWSNITFIFFISFLSVFRASAVVGSVCPECEAEIPLRIRKCSDTARDATDDFAGQLPRSSNFLNQPRPLKSQPHVYNQQSHANCSGELNFPFQKLLLCVQMLIPVIQIAEKYVFVHMLNVSNRVWTKSVWCQQEIVFMKR